VETKLPPDAFLFFLTDHSSLVVSISLDFCQVKSPFLLGIFLILWPEAWIPMGCRIELITCATTDLDPLLTVGDEVSVALGVGVGVGVSDALADGDGVSETVGVGIGVGLGATTLTSPLRNVGTVMVVGSPRYPVQKINFCYKYVHLHR
jgi:hypothetical protein